MKTRASKPLPETIPTSSMADIAFLLIIFFMLTLTIEVDKTQVDLPKTSLRLEVPKKSAYVSIDASEVIRLSDGEEVSVIKPAEEVFAFAANVIGNDPSKEFVLKADSTVPYRVVDQVIDDLKRAKVRVIYLLSNQKTVDG